ncbi:uncharacterized mitochondrial protein AtMg00310-like [Henckelia pumila]|uniref:uncharacterized mitochondrial protein AtMg00310-like n=1 Tax=Henckelia pumila TaxID=405737 RepID=UPI003C6DE836
MPNSVCDGIDQACAKFWWIDHTGKRGLHWLKCSELCKPKCHGGMGFRKQGAFNKALVAKQVWRLIQFPSSLMARILKARYFKHKDIMDADLEVNPSYIWRSFLWSRVLLQRGLCWRVGTGQSIVIGKDPWIPSLPQFRCSSMVHATSNDTVDSLISPMGNWNEEAVNQKISLFEAESILNISLNRRGCPDLRYWKGNSNGIY